MKKPPKKFNREQYIEMYGFVKKKGEQPSGNPLTLWFQCKSFGFVEPDWFQKPSLVMQAHVNSRRKRRFKRLIFFIVFVMIFCFILAVKS